MTEAHVGDALELTLDIWHPDCWTLQATADAEASLLGHGLYASGGTVYGTFTALARTGEVADRLVETVARSPLTDDVRETGRGRGRAGGSAPAGTVTRGFLAEWRADRGRNVVETLVRHGFVPRRTYHVREGRERWSVLVGAERPEAADRLDDVRAEADADVAVQRVTTAGRDPAGPARRDVLTPRQREVFEYACERGYYDWPRETSATALAADLGVTKSTVVEHLRKAESRLFTPFE